MNEKDITAVKIWPRLRKFLKLPTLALMSYTVLQVIVHSL